jgi:hypothetical protein
MFDYNLDGKNHKNGDTAPVEYLFDIVLRIGQSVVGTCSPSQLSMYIIAIVLKVGVEKNM